jgi:endo-beta-N-acetylglucosaminidase D
MGIKKGGIMENWKDYEKSSDTKFDNISDFYYFDILLMRESEIEDFYSREKIFFSNFARDNLQRPLKKLELID